MAKKFWKLWQKQEKQENQHGVRLLSLNNVLGHYFFGMEGHGHARDWKRIIQFGWSCS